MIPCNIRSYHVITLDSNLALSVAGDIYPSQVCNTKVSQHFLPLTVVRETLNEYKSHNCLLLLLCCCFLVVSRFIRVFLPNHLVLYSYILFH